MVFLRRLSKTHSPPIITQDVQSLIKKFIINDFGSTSADTSNESISQLYHNWKLIPNQTIPLQSPISASPFQFHSTVNTDESYVKIPRLAVTKMLVERWCELREYYSVYSGSIAIRPTKSIQLGVERHLELELEIHLKIDITALELTLDEVYSEIVQREELIATEEAADLEYLKNTERLSTSVEEFTQLVYGSVEASDLACQWSDQIISRLYSLITTSEAREVLVHCYVDLLEGKFVDETDGLLIDQTEPGVLNPRKVLVSGIIDHLKLINVKNENDFSLFDEINWSMEYNCNQVIDQNILLDPTRFLKSTIKIVQDHKDTFKIRTTDVKTRSYNRIPPQLSVLNSAKFQTLYYRKMLGLLAGEHQQDKHFGYYSLLENARQRGINVDEPINMVTIISLLRQNYQLFYKDFVKLAKGESIGFEPYDIYMEENSFDSYDLNQLIQMEMQIEEKLSDDYHVLQNSPLYYKPFERLSLTENFDYNTLFTDELITPWKYPPTLRYFAARSSQFYSLLEEMLGNTTTVEYHNVKTHVCFHTNEYNYDNDELQRQLVASSNFWNGKRKPDYTTDLDKCKYCEFKAKCAVPNGEIDKFGDKELIGHKVHRFLEED